VLQPPLRVVGPRALVQGLKVDDLLVHRYSTVYQDGVELYGNAKCGLHYLINSRAMCPIKSCLLSCTAGQEL